MAERRELRERSRIFEVKENWTFRCGARATRGPAKGPARSLVWKRAAHGVDIESLLLCPLLESIDGGLIQLWLTAENPET